jgi:hypothetical protein
MRNGLKLTELATGLLKGKIFNEFALNLSLYKESCDIHK